MANHVRRQLREAVATAVTGLTTTGARVYQSRVYPLQTTDLPCLVVTSDGDDIEYLTLNTPAQQQRETTIRIEAYVRGTADVDDTMDLISKEVEIAIAGMSTFKNITLRATRLEMDQGDQPIGKNTMIFKTDLYTVSNAPDVLIG